MFVMVAKKRLIKAIKEGSLASLHIEIDSAMLHSSKDAAEHDTYEPCNKTRLWKSLDSASMLTLLSQGLFATQDMDACSEAPVQHETSLDFILPPPRKFCKAGSKDVQSSIEETLFGQLHCENLDVADLVAYSPNTALDISVQSEQNLRRQYRRIANFASGLQNEVERRNQSAAAKLNLNATLPRFNSCRLSRS